MTGEGPLQLAQAWIDREQVLADIVDLRWEPVAKLRARVLPPEPRQPHRAAETLTLRGQTISVLCEET